jgi:hypothetical protein
VTEPVPARDLRVSDDERRHVVSLLERATGRGLIDIDEFTTRVDTALAARTRGELNAVLIDLPGLVHPDGPVRTAAPLARPRATAAAAPAGSGSSLDAVLSSVSRRGRWEVPARLRVHVAMGSADLDFSETDVPHEVVEIEVDVTAGSVELRLPEHARVDRDGVSAVLGSVSEHLRGGDGSGPLFVLRGSVRAGSVEVRGPRKRWFRRR